MMLADLTDVDIRLLYEGSDPDDRKKFNILKLNRFQILIEKVESANYDGGEFFDYVEKRMADIQVSDLIAKVANNG